MANTIGFDGSCETRSKKKQRETLAFQGLRDTISLASELALSLLEKRTDALCKVLRLETLD